MSDKCIISLNYNAKGLAALLTSTNCSVVNVSGSFSVLSVTLRERSSEVLCLVRSVERFRPKRGIDTIMDTYSDVGCVLRPRSLRTIFFYIDRDLGRNNVFVFSIGAPCGCRILVTSGAVTRGHSRNDFV